MRTLNLLLLLWSAVSGSIQGADDRAGPAAGPCHAPPQEPDTLAGSWEGALGSPPAAVSFRLSFSREGDDWSATFSVPDDGIRDFPAHAVERSEGEVAVWLTAQRVFRGAPTGDSLPGHLVFHDRDGHSEELVLYREGTPAWEALGADLARWREERMAAPAPEFEEASRGPARDRVDQDALEHLVESARASRSSALVVLQGGELVGSWHDPRGARRIEAMSVTKAVLSLAVGRLLALGKLESVDAPVHRFFPEWEEGARSRVTVRHLLTHTSGLATPMPAIPIYESGDFLRFALEADMESEPGTEFVYNNNATNLLAGVIGVAAETRADRFIGEELFGPLGITDFTWSLDREGNPHGMAGLQIRAADLARLGQLVVQDGVWENERLLPPDWVAESLAPAPAPAEQTGFLWWVIRDEGQVVGARADGYLGQYLVIYPEKELVGVRMIEGFDGYDRDRDGFPEFQELLRELQLSPR